MSRIRYRSPLRAAVYEMRGLFLWWGLLAAATGLLLLWHVRQARPALFAPAAAVALAAWAAPVLALWSLLSPRRPDSLPADGGDGDGWRKALRALARFLIYQETRGDCDRETKALLRDGEKRVRAALKGVHGARQLQAAWNDVREAVVAVWAEKTWQRVRPDILAIAREVPPEGADAYGYRSSRNWRAAREVFRRTLPQGLALERSRWEIRSEVMALLCAQDGRFPGVPTPVLAGLFALVLSDLSLPWDPETAIGRIRPWAEREARLLAEEGGAV
ncbi:MAG: hypothetical protein IJS32_07990, partial [Kiritimatiellae bacterium]|nr:hypothetical protein [Kiritimatiellia bacterium]